MRRFLLLFLILTCPLCAQSKLVQNVAKDVKVGPFVDSTGAALTGLTLSQADIRLAKNDAAWAQKNQASACAHEENGWYECSLDTTDTNTTGVLILAVNETGALPVWQTFEIIPQASYDHHVGGDVASVADVVSGIHSDLVPGSYPAGTAGYALGHGGASVSGTADSGTTTTMVDAARTEADTNYWVGSVIVFTSGTISGQTRYITGFNASTDTITFDPATTQAVGTQTYEIRPGVDYVRFNSIYEGTQTFKSFLQYGASALFGKYNSSGGTFNFRDIADTLNRIVYTTTATSRSSVTLTPTP